MHMKITKNTKNGKLEFYRDVKEGGLRDPKSKTIWTSETIKRMDINKSLKGRILAYGTSLGSSNPYSMFVDSLIRENKEISLSELKREQCKKENVQKYLSAYGRMINYGTEENTSLGNLLVEYGNGAEISEALVQIKKQILKLKRHKKKSLLDSFMNNKIPFKLTNGKLEPATDKMSRLFSLLEEDGVDKNKFEKYKTWYQYEVLKERFDLICEEHFSAAERKPRVLAKKIYSAVKLYNKEKANSDVIKNKDDAYSLFLDEIRDHFRKYFPVTGKKGLSSGGDSEKLNSLASEKNVKYYYSDKYVFQQVWRQIVNQLTAGLIQYGKLSYYFHDKENHTWQEEKLNSEGMQEIQVRETFKKQLFLSVVWSVNKLNYFFQYGGENPKMLYQVKYDEDCIAGDIIEELRKADFSRFCYDDPIKNNYIHRFMHGIKEEPEKFELLFDKMSVSYPLEEEDKNPEEILKVLQEINCSVTDLRHSTIHYQKDVVYQETQGPKYPKASEFLRRDIDNIENCFLEQIRSMSLAEYYPLDLLQKVFKDCNLNFQLYASQVPMVPSFQKVFGKGVNLYKADQKSDSLKWYMEVRKDPEAKLATLAYRNFIQLIYYHGFLPAVEKNNALVTDFINETVEWNQERSLQSQREDPETKYINFSKYRYQGMPEFQNKSLLEYMSELQRDQSNKEKEDSQADVPEDKKKRYYTKFIQDIFAFSFGSFLNSKLNECREDLLQPRYQEMKTNEDREQRLKKLLEDLEMKTNIKNGSPTQLAMYPFLKLLDQRGLNQLLHQFIRYSASVKNSFMQDDKALNLNREIEELIALVAFTKRPLMNTEAYSKAIEMLSETFIEGEIKDYADLYYQSDQEHSVLHRNIAYMGGTGVIALYSDVLRDCYRVKKTDYVEYKKANSKENGRQFTRIGEDQKRLQDLHESLIGRYNSGQIQEYKKLLRKTHEYNVLKKRITFENMYEIYQLHTELLGRLASFAEDWERDMLFLLTGLESRGLIEDRVEKIFLKDKGGVVAKMNKNLKDNEKLLKSLYCREDQESTDFWKTFHVRNAVAHFNHFTQKSQSKGGSVVYQRSIEELINRIRGLLAYDMKRQNAVTQAVQKIFDKHQMIIKFKPVTINSDPEKWVGTWNIEFGIDCIRSKNIVHFKNLSDRICLIEAHDRNTIKAIEKLMKFKYN